MHVLLVSFISLTLISCQATNSNSFDNQRYSNGGTQETDPNFSPAYQVIRNSCISCHQGYHNSWSSFKTNQQWMNSGLVIQGDANNSMLIKMIYNSNSPGASMPPAGPLANEEYEKIKLWIDQIP